MKHSAVGIVFCVIQVGPADGSTSWTVPQCISFAQTALCDVLLHAVIHTVAACPLLFVELYYPSQPLPCVGGPGGVTASLMCNLGEAMVSAGNAAPVDNEVLAQAFQHYINVPDVERLSPEMALSQDTVYRLQTPFPLQTSSPTSQRPERKAKAGKRDGRQQSDSNRLQAKSGKPHLPSAFVDEELQQSQALHQETDQQPNTESQLLGLATHAPQTGTTEVTAECTRQGESVEPGQPLPVVVHAAISSSGSETGVSAHSPTLTQEGNVEDKVTAADVEETLEAVAVHDDMPAGDVPGVDMPSCDMPGGQQLQEAVSGCGDEVQGDTEIGETATSLQGKMLQYGLPGTLPSNCQYSDLYKQWIQGERVHVDHDTSRGSQMPEDAGQSAGCPSTGASSPQCQYKPSELSISEDGTIEFLMSHVVSPSLFWVHVVSQHCSQSLDRLMSQLNGIYGTMKKVQFRRHFENWDPSLHSVCCAQFSEDNKFYRAKVINFRYEYEDNDGAAGAEPSAHTRVHKIKVLYVDFGNTEWLNPRRVYPLPPQFLDIPPLAVCCMLAGIEPVCTSPLPEPHVEGIAAGHDMERGRRTRWNRTTCQAFVRLTGFDKKLLAYVTRLEQAGTVLQYVLK